MLLCKFVPIIRIRKVDNKDQYVLRDLKLFKP